MLNTLYPLLLFCSCVLRPVSGDDSATLPSPLSLPPSLEWDGNDGKWSTFAVQIGTPPQAVRLLPNTGGQSILAVLPQGCSSWEGSDCPNSRGNTFNPNESSTWENKGTYQLPISALHYLPYDGSGIFGFDNITLDWQAHGGNALSEQIVGGYVTEDFRIGSLGISPLSINITSPNDQFPSFVGTLSERNLIPSTSYGYLAGASYYSYPIQAYGSLTFGGYDLTRLDVTKNLTLAGGSDEYRPILLGIESITSGSDQLLLSEPIITALDSLASQIWLPVSVCKAFEDAFGITYNETYGLYILDDAQHETLLQRNPSITFTLSTGSSGSPDRLNITLPYAAFDLEASYPLAGNETVRYFPLLQAVNETQYTLGRTFLQEVYLIADYARGKITLYPAVYPESTVQSKLETICPLNATSCHDPRYPAIITSDPDPDSSSFPIAAIVGLVAGVLLLLVLAAAIWFALRRRRRHRHRRTKRARLAELDASKAAPANGLAPGDKPELADTQTTNAKFGGELDGRAGLLLESSRPGLMMPMKPTPELMESGGSNTTLLRQELEGSGTVEQRFEMPANEEIPGSGWRSNSIAKGRWVED